MPSTEPGPILCTVTRSGRVESWHRGAVAVVHAGTTWLAAGDVDRPVYCRSAVKPLQALPLLECGLDQRLGLGAAELAVLVASHGGTPAQVAAVRSILAKATLSEDLLGCGPQPPSDPEARNALVAAGGRPQKVHNNCSGKHAGMLLACRLLGLPSADYVSPSHPLQERILTLVGRMVGLEPREIGIGIDGCSVPAYHMPVAAAARGYATLADPAAAGLPADLAAAVRRIVAAMTGEPGMVAGPGRFTTRLMEVTGGRVLGKEGAEGFYAAAVRGPVALGIAVKIADGGERCRDGVVLDLLRETGSLSGEEFAALSAHYRPTLTNCRGLEVGEVRPEVDLLECAD